MATRIRFNGTRTVPEAWAGTPTWPTGPQADITRAAPTASMFGGWTEGKQFDGIVEPLDEGHFARLAGSPAPVQWWSERVAAEVTISGTVTFASYNQTVTGGWSGKVRFRLYKITAGGSAIRTLIATATTATFSAVGQRTATATPISTVLSPGERFIIIATIVEHNALGNVRINSGSGSDTVTCWVEFTETVTFLDNAPRFYQRRDATIAIDDFLDLSLSRGSLGATTGVVATEASGTEIQWTRSVPEAFGATDISAAAVADTANASTYVSGSFTPVANRLYLLAVVHSDAAPETTVPTITTTTGLVFVQVGSSLPFDTIASNLHRLTLFRAMKASGLSAGTLTVNLADSATGCCARLTEVSGVVTTGTDGADAVINDSPNSANANANPSVTLLAAFDDVDNGTYACFASDIATAPTAGSGFTGLGHSTIGTPTKGVFAEWRATNDTTADCTLASSDWAGIAVELVQQAAGSPILLEWIGPRVKEPFMIDTIDHFFGVVWVHESDAAANCGFVVKVFHRAPDGTETLVWSNAKVGEMNASVQGIDFPTSALMATPVLHQATAFHEDDRPVFRAYITNIGTMAAGHTCTYTYDHNVSTGVGDAYVSIYGARTFKAEGDPAGSHAIPDGMSMGGVSNDGA